MERWLVGGTVVDGRGGPRQQADVHLVGDTIHAVGPAIGPPPTGGNDPAVIDATGLIVAPGFIDLHSHSDIALLAEPLVACKLDQGITLEVLGQDGLSVAPLTDDVADVWRHHLAGITGNYALPWDWRAFDDYLGRFETLAPNVAALVGHGTLRVNVVGMADRPATPSELDRMQGLLREALAAGAFGLSGGLVYTPGSYAPFEELVALNRLVADSGKLWVVHVRFEGDRIDAALDEMFRLVEETGVALHVSHFKVMGKANAGRGQEIVARVERQRQRGMDVTVDQYPYTAASTTLTAILPPWVHADGPARLRQYLTDRGACRQMADEIETGLPDWEGFVALAGWENVSISNVGGETHGDLVGRSLAAIAATWHCTPFEAAARLLLDADLAVTMVVHAMDERDVTAILRQPWRMGGTDAVLGGKPHPRAYGSFPRVLGRYVRDRQVLSLELAIHQMTGAAAERLRLTDRGVIAPGKKADLCLFDADRIADRATFEDPTQAPSGVAWVIVNGEPVVRDGRPTGHLPGRVLRQRADAAE
jgi:N-acyl-D-amino-acid deacylase